MGFTVIAARMDFSVVKHTLGNWKAYGKMSKPNKDIKQADGCLNCIWIYVCVSTVV